MEYHVRSGIASLYRTPLHGGREDFLRLDMNENPEGLPSEFVRNALGGITPEMLAMYPDTEPLTNALSFYLNIDPAQVILFNGSDDGIKTIFETFGLQGKKIISVYPTFEMYAVYAKMYEMEHLAIPYDENFSLSYDAILNAIDDETAMVCLLNPNNPIGTVFEKEQIERVIEKAQSHHAMVIIDEAYHYFYPVTFLGLIKEKKNVIVLRTFSKLCSMAGLRIGYAAACEEVVEYLRRASQTFRVNCIAVHFAKKLIEQPHLIETLVAIEQQGHAYIISKLEESGYRFYSRNGNYVFIGCKDDHMAVAQRLRDEKVLVKTYSLPIFKGYIRITTGSVSAMTRFWQAFERADQPGGKK